MLDGVDAGHALREQLRALLRAWEGGVIDEAEVRDTAEQLDFKWEAWRQLDRLPLGTEPPALLATVDILGVLSSLHLELATRADIPKMLECLNLIDDDPAEARGRWAAYFDAVDWESRERELADDPFYWVVDVRRTR